MSFIKCYTGFTQKCKSIFGNNKFYPINTFFVKSYNVNIKF